MSQSTALINALKQALKQQGFTYADVAKGLDMSEANIKRMFSGQRFYLKVFDEICQLIGIHMSDLAKQVERESQSLEQLSESQEKELVSDPKLLLLTFMVINGVVFDDIIQEYRLSEIEAISYLTRLDRLKIIELLPFNRVKLLIAPNFQWRRGGPIQQFFTHSLQQDFLDHGFDDHGELLRFMSGVMSSASKEQLIIKLKQLATEFSDFNHQDARLPFEQRHLTSMILAIRAWSPKSFERFRKTQEP